MTELLARLGKLAEAAQRDEDVDLAEVEAVATRIEALAPTVPRAVLQTLNRELQRTLLAIAAHRDRLVQQIASGDDALRASRAYAHLRAHRSGQRVARRA